jgi:exopolysaccharide biosynthesis polyprenyl glycosylphosphotransferase
VSSSSGTATIERERVAAPSANVAIVHDYLTQRGGAERVVLAMTRAFPGVPVHTSLYDSWATFPEFGDVAVVAQNLNRWRVLRRYHRAALPLLAQSFSSMHVDADVVVCSSSGWSHGVQTEGRKVVYCHNPARWLYQSDGYLKPSRAGVVRAGLSIVQQRLLEWDRRAASSAARYLVNSAAVRDRVRNAYGVDAEVLHPPHGVDPRGAQQEVPDLDPGFLICVSRLLPYKNVDVVVDAMRNLPSERLVVVGSGPQEQALRAAAPSNVTLLGAVTDPQLRWLYASASGLVAASYEDFGLTPIEAAAFGVPAAVLRWGGFLDTMDEGTTGVFFDDPTPLAVAEAVHRLRSERWNPGAIAEHADSFSEARFNVRLREVVAEEASATAAGPAPPAAVRSDRERTVERLRIQLHARRHAEVASAPGTLRRSGIKAAVVLSDVLALVVGMVAALAVVAATRGGVADGDDVHATLGAISLPVWIAALSHAGLYRSRFFSGFMEELRRIIGSGAVAVMAVSAAAFLLQLYVARSWLVASFVLGVGSLGVERRLLRGLFRRQRHRGRLLRPIVIVGANEEARAICRQLVNDPTLGYDVRGFVADDVAPGTVLAPGRPVLGSVQDTLTAVRRTGANGVFIATTATELGPSNRLTRQLTEAGVHVELSSSLRDVAAHRLTIRPVGRFPAVYVEPVRRSGWRAAAKRAFDLVVASVGLVAALPVLLLAVVAIQLTSPGPVVRRQRRLGRDGRTFPLLKLRTAKRGDDRSTRVGAIVRALWIDELPQLWNVVTGELSVVGPRPALPTDVDRWPPELHNRLRVKPGITGMWQVNSEATYEDYSRLDLYYVDNWSLWTDLAIVLRTLPAVLRRARR